MQEPHDLINATGDPYRPPVSTPLPSEEPSPLAGRRPILITAMCVLGILGIFMVIPMFFSAATRNIGPWYPPFLVFSAVVGTICLYGFWKMKRWAFFGYIAFVGVNQLVLVAKDVWTPGALVGPLVFIGIVALYYKRLR